MNSIDSIYNSIFKLSRTPNGASGRRRRLVAQALFGTVILLWCRILYLRWPRATFDEGKPVTNTFNDSSDGLLPTVFIVVFFSPRNNHHTPYLSRSYIFYISPVGL